MASILALIKVSVLSNSVFLRFFLLSKCLRLSMYYISCSGFCRMRANLDPTTKTKFSIFGSFC